MANQIISLLVLYPSKYLLFRCNPIYMQRRDLLLSLAAAFLIALYLLPTLINTNLIFKIPQPLLLLFVALPILTLIAIYIAWYIAKKIKLLWQLFKFSLVGVLNTAIDFGILNFFIFITQVTSGAGIILINATSFSTALVNSYFWNRDWVFDQTKKSKFLTFAVVTLIGLSINTGVVYILTTYIQPILVTSPTLLANLAKVAATLLSLIWNFTGYKLVVFKK